MDEYRNCEGAIISTDSAATNYLWWCLHHGAGANNPHYCTAASEVA